MQASTDSGQNLSEHPRRRPSSGARILDSALDFLVVPGYTRLGYRLRGLSWADAAAGSLEGRAALVTGASSGLGEAACEGLARAGARVHMLVRDRERGRRARDRIAASLAGRAELELEVCDLADLSAMRGFARSFAACEPKLDLLVNNAGVLPNERRLSTDGFELAFATNVLAPFLLTGLLLEPLRRSADARVINVSSGGMYTARLDLDDLQLERRDYDGASAYAHTKRAEVVLTHAWAERLAKDGIACHSMHPGWADTPGVRGSLPTFHRLLGPLLRDPRQGADTIVWLATTERERLDAHPGAFWHDRLPRSEHRVPWTRESRGEREQLWAQCARMVGLGDQQPIERNQ